MTPIEEVKQQKNKVEGEIVACAVVFIILIISAIFLLIKSSIFI